MHCNTVDSLLECHLTVTLHSFLLCSFISSMILWQIGYILVGVIWFGWLDKRESAFYEDNSFSLFIAVAEWSLLVQRFVLPSGFPLYSKTKANPGTSQSKKWSANYSPKCLSLTGKNTNFMTSSSKKWNIFVCMPSFCITFWICIQVASVLSYRIHTLILLLLSFWFN